MSFVAVIRDYMDLCTSLMNSSSKPEIFLMVQSSCVFFFQALINSVQYFLTFGWFRAILYLPVTIPKLHYAVFSEHFFLDDLQVKALSLVDNLSSRSTLSLLACGLLNSFFLCLPFSTTHLLSTRRLLVQGVYAGASSILGTIVGQSLFIFLVLSGCRFVVSSALPFDSLAYIFGLGLILWVIYDMATEKRLRSLESSEYSNLSRIFMISFLLTWTEQTTFYQYLTNLNLGPESHLLQLELGSGSSFFGHLSYCFGLVFGQCFFMTLFVWSTLALKQGVFAFSRLPYSVFLKRLNLASLTLLFSLSLSSLPYYGLDYLLTAPLGFTSQDKALEASLFSQKNLKDSNRLLSSLDVVVPFSIDTDISYFDRGDYGEPPGFFKRYFEALNYQSEYAWLCRRDKKPNLYASGQTAKTVIRDLLQPVNLDVEKTQELANNQANAKSKGPKRQTGLAVLEHQKQHSRFRQKLKKRFNDNYTEKRNEWRTSSGYAIGDSFNTFQSLQEVPKTAQFLAEASLKQKYYANPVYRTLLTIDIDSFLRRQPQKAFLSEQDENELFQKRYLLSRYYDTIRQYEHLPYAEEFKEIFQGSKSFSDRVYNHQFKGSLSVLRRLFAITLDEEENQAQKAVLKFDQPLFLQEKANSPNHEELKPQSSQMSPFLEVTDSSPFYLGWDDGSRQMVLTKRFAPQARTSTMLFEKNPGSFYKDLKGLKPNESIAQPITFSAWPIPKDKLFSLKAKPTNQVMTLFEPITNSQMNYLVDTVSKDFTKSLNQPYTFPENMRYFGRTAERLAPNQGGFVWPGTF